MVDLMGPLVMDVCPLHFLCMEFNTLVCVEELLAIKLEDQLHFIHGTHKMGLGIDRYYVDGISLTHGQSPRQHIWSFAGAA